MKMVALERMFVNSNVWNLVTKHFLYRPFLASIKENPKKILEIGCGMGFTTQLIADMFRNSGITAVDLDSDQISKASHKIKRASVHFVQGSATRLDIDDEEIDAVFAFMAFHHIPDYQKAVRECSRVLKKGGMLYVVDIGRYSIHRFQSIFPAAKVFSKNEFIKLVKEAGFIITKKSGNNFRFSLMAKKS